MNKETNKITRRLIRRQTSNIIADAGIIGWDIVLIDYTDNHHLFMGNKRNGTMLYQAVATGKSEICIDSGITSKEKFVEGVYQFIHGQGW